MHTQSCRLIPQETWFVSRMTRMSQSLLLSMLKPSSMAMRLPLLRQRPITTSFIARRSNLPLCATHIRSPTALSSESPQRPSTILSRRRTPEDGWNYEKNRPRLSWILYMLTLITIANVASIRLAKWYDDWADKREGRSWQTETYTPPESNGNMTLRIAQRVIRMSRNLTPLMTRQDTGSSECSR